MTGCFRRRIFAFAILALPLATPVHAAEAAAEPTQLDQLAAALAKTHDKLQALEAEVAKLSTDNAKTREALARELAQPVLLLVGEGRCPLGFERVQTEVLLLSGPRTAKNSALLDAAGLADDEQVGVGSRVYRYLDFCLRAANSVTVK